MDSFKKFFVLFVGTRHVFNREHIPIAIFPGFCEAKHFIPYGVVHQKEIVGLIVVFAENRVVGKKLINGVAYLVPFMQSLTEVFCIRVSDGTNLFQVIAIFGQCILACSEIVLAIIRARRTDRKYGQYE